MSLQYNQYLFAMGISHCTAVCCIVISVVCCGQESFCLILLMIFCECEFKYVHTSRHGVHEAVAFISGTSALNSRLEGVWWYQKPPVIIQENGFALGRRHCGEDTHFQVEIHRLRAVIFKVGWKHQCFRTLS